MTVCRKLYPSTKGLLASRHPSFAQPRFYKVFDHVLAVRWFSLSAAAEKEIVRVVLEKLYYMRFDSDTELKSTDNQRTCELPDGIIIPVDAERFHRVDILFQPRFHWQRSQRIPRHFFLEQHETTSTSARSFSLMSCCQAARPCSERMTNELTALFPFTTKIKMVALSM